MDVRRLSHSQNFLTNPDFVDRLVEQACITRDDVVIEIGPGRGIITKVLARKAARVIGIEVDHQLAEDLSQRFADVSNAKIIEADFLRWKLPDKSYKVFSNIPFNMTADILNKLLFAEKPPQDAYIIMQDAAAGKFIGPPYGPMSQMTALLQPFFEMEVLASIDRRNFDPVPNINVVLARFAQRANPLIERRLRGLYSDFVIYGYNQWKPMITESLKAIFSRKQLAIMERNIGLAGLKPTDVTTHQWVQMFKTFMQLAPDNKKDLVRGAEARQISKQKDMQKHHRTRKW